MQAAAQATHTGRQATWHVNNAARAACMHAYARGSAGVSVDQQVKH
jgi:hypothetical protein